MDLNYLRKIVKIFDESTVSELSVEEEGIKLKLSKSSKDRTTQYIGHYPPPPQQALPHIHQEPVKQSLADFSSVQNDKISIQSEANAKETKQHTIHSPIVGTFYRSPSPDSKPFAEIGTHINKGDTLCIIEAMKLMNEIESDISGTVENVFVENAQPVEYKQPLFLIKPD